MQFKKAKTMALREAQLKQDEFDQLKKSFEAERKVKILKICSVFILDFWVFINFYSTNIHAG